MVFESTSDGTIVNKPAILQARHCAERCNSRQLDLASACHPQARAELRVVSAGLSSLQQGEL